MLHESTVLKILPEELQPPSDVKCRGCVHGLWRIRRDSILAENKRVVDVYCKQFYAVMYSTTEIDTEFTECDGFSDEIKELVDGLKST